MIIKSTKVFITEYDISLLGKTISNMTICQKLNNSLELEEDITQLKRLHRDFKEELEKEDT